MNFVVTRTRVLLSRLGRYSTIHNAIQLNIKEIQNRNVRFQQPVLFYSSFHTYKPAAVVRLRIYYNRMNIKTCLFVTVLRFKICFIRVAGIHL